MPKTGVFTFSDPSAYEAAVRPADVEILVTTKGDFRASLTRNELSRLWVQRGDENLPRIANSTASADRPPIFFLTGPDQASITHSGRDFAFGEIAIAGSGLTHHHRTEGPCQWGTLSVTRDDLAIAGYTFVGRDLVKRSATHYLRPSPAMFSRLLNLHHKAGQLAATDAAHILEQSEPARALEQALLHALVMCLSGSMPDKMGSGTLRHATIIARFEELLAANYDRPVYLAEICAAIGASERILRISCMEHLGVGPVRYLWLRRMHLARRTLVLASPATATVTEIATGNGFFELGRFSVEYRTLFGEAPSVTLHRRSEELKKPQSNPFSFAE